MDTLGVLSLAVALLAAVLAALLTVADALLTGVSRFRAQTLVDEDRPGAQLCGIKLLRLPEGAHERLAAFVESA